MRKTHKTPFNTARASRQGRPRFRPGLCGSKGLRIAHRASVRSMNTFWPSPRPSTTSNSTCCDL